MKKTVRKAVLAAMVLTTVCGGAQMSWATDPITMDLSNISVSDNVHTCSVQAVGGTLNANTEEINISNS